MGNNDESSKRDKESFLIYYSLLLQTLQDFGYIILKTTCENSGNALLISTVFYDKDYGKSFIKMIDEMKDLRIYIGPYSDRNYISESIRIRKEVFTGFLLDYPQILIDYITDSLGVRVITI